MVAGNNPKHGGRDETAPGFECPVCGSERYEPLVVNRPDGSTSTLNFYRCINCGYAFGDPSLHRKKRS